MHEVIHAILAMTGHSDTQVEGHVEALGYALIAFMRNNPEFVEWVMEESTESPAQPPLINRYVEQYRKEYEDAGENDEK